MSKAMMALLLLVVAAVLEVNAQGFLANNGTNTTVTTTTNTTTTTVTTTTVTTTTVTTTTVTTTMGNSSAAPQNGTAAGKAGLMGGADLLKPGAFVLVGLSAFVSFWVM